MLCTGADGALYQYKALEKLRRDVTEFPMLNNFYSSVELFTGGDYGHGLLSTGWHGAKTVANRLKNIHAGAPDSKMLKFTSCNPNPHWGDRSYFDNAFVTLDEKPVRDSNGNLSVKLIGGGGFARKRISTTATRINYFAVMEVDKPMDCRLFGTRFSHFSIHDGKLYCKKDGAVIQGIDIPNKVFLASYEIDLVKKRVSLRINGQRIFERSASNKIDANWDFVTLGGGFCGNLTSFGYLYDMTEDQKLLLESELMRLCGF